MPAASVLFKHLLVPVDGSELSVRAMEGSIALARQLGATVTGFVVEPMAPLPAVGRPAALVESESRLHDARTEAHARGVLNRFEALAQAAGVGFEGLFKRSDLIGEAIVEAARERGCDMIVMATHGRGLFGEMMFGSYTRTVLARSKLPLLVLQ